jgi:hypothetical protein
MTKFRLTLVCLATLLMFTALPNMAQAWDGYGWGGGGYNRPAQNNFGMWGRSPSSLYNLGHIPVPPYFALHPPVYYGQRVFRSYGESPFPRSGLQRYEIQVVNPANITNPFFELTVPAKVEKAEAAEPQVAANSKLILNPFFYQADKQLAKSQ